MRKINSNMYQEQIEQPVRRKIAQEQVERPVRVSEPKDYAEAQPSSGGNNGGSGKSKKPLVIILSVVGGLLVVCALLYFLLFSPRMNYMNKLKNSDVFLNGVTVDGVDISGLTVEQATEKINAAHDANPYEEVKFTLTLSDRAKELKQLSEEAEEAKNQKAAEEALKAAENKDAATVAADAAEAADAANADAIADAVAAEEPQETVAPAEETEVAEETPAIVNKDADGNYLLTKKELNLQFNTAEVLEEALALGKDIEDYDEAVEFVKGIAANGKAYTTKYTIDKEATAKAIAEIAKDCHLEPTDARFEIDVAKDAAAEAQEAQDNASKKTEKTDEEASTTSKFKYIEEIPGFDIDEQALLATVTEKAAAYTFGEIEMPIIEKTAEITVEVLKTQIVLRGTETTDFSSSSSNRVYNVTRAAGMVNGIVVEPGEVFSMNDTLGVRTEKNGWKLAGALQGGQVDVQQAGGGVCQIATTMYNAVVKADLEIVYRQNHSELSHYVDGGLDATINSVGNEIDFKWKNNLDSSVIIIAYTTPAKKLVVEIYGKPFGEEYNEIKLSSEKLQSVEPAADITYQEDPTLAPGQTKVLVKRRTGSKWVSYKHYLKDGVEVKSEVLAYSTYRAYNGVTLVGPGTVVPAQVAPQVTEEATEPPATDPPATE